MANTLHLQQTSPWTVDRVHATVGDAVRALAADHTLALSAATIAASSPRQRLAEVRAMYVPPLDPHPDSDVVSLNTSCAT